MVIIRDPASGQGVDVKSDGHLQVDAVASPRDFQISLVDEQVYTVISEDAAQANEETIYLQNTSSTKNLIIDDIIICGDTSGLWRVKFVTGTAAGGSALTAVNLNKTSSNSADVTARGDGAVTGLTDDGDIAMVRVVAETTVEIKLDEALILGQNDAIAVECETTQTAAEITIEFHLE